MEDNEKELEIICDDLFQISQELITTEHDKWTNAIESIKHKNNR